MHRIDTATASRDKFGAGKNGFTNGNPQTGVPATDLNAAFLTAFRRRSATLLNRERGPPLTVTAIFNCWMR